MSSLECDGPQTRKRQRLASLASSSLIVSQSRRSSHLPALPLADSQLASSVLPPSLPSNRLPGSPVANSRLSSVVASPVLPSDCLPTRPSANPPTCVVVASSGSAVRPVSRPNLPSILRRCQRPTSDFHRVLASSAVPAIHFRLTACSSVEGTLCAGHLCMQVQNL